MKIKLNGEVQEFEAETLGQLVVQHGLSPESIVIERNQAIVPKEAWEATRLGDGDQVEIVSFVGGG